MKKWIFSLCLTLLLVSCVTTAEQAAKRAEREAATAKIIAEKVQDRRFEIEVTFMYPERGRSVPVSSDYGIEVRGDTLISYLPYFGVAYNVPYGGGVGLNFTSIIDHYAAQRTRKDMTSIEIATHNDEDRYLYTIDVFDNGRADIDVFAQERDHINFSGEMLVDQ